MNLLICGGRDFNNEDLMVESINQLLDELGLVEAQITIISGMAKGADLMAYEIALHNGIKTICMPADWDKYGKSAGFKRNLQMLNHADYVLAFWDCLSKGTAHTITEAGKRNIPVKVINY